MKPGSSASTPACPCGWRGNFAPRRWSSGAIRSTTPSIRTPSPTSSARPCPFARRAPSTSSTQTSPAWTASSAAGSTRGNSASASSAKPACPFPSACRRTRPSPRWPPARPSPTTPCASNAAPSGPSWPRWASARFPWSARKHIRPSATSASGESAPSRRCRST